MHPPDQWNNDERQRASMVTHQLEARGICDDRVLAAMGAIPREVFVPEDLRSQAYQDGPLPIGQGQTISQPFTVAVGCEALLLNGHEKVLEVGTGSGYAACVLSRLAQQVHSVERIPELAAAAADRLRRLNIRNVQIHVGDGSLGLPEEAPFDAIIVAAAAPALPKAYPQQLAEGGRIVIPIGPPHRQSMMRYTLSNGHLHQENLGAYCFVPLIGADACPP